MDRGVLAWAGSEELSGVVAPKLGGSPNPGGALSVVAGVLSPNDGGVARNAGGSPARAGRSFSKSGRFRPPKPLVAALSGDGDGVAVGAAQSKLGGGGGGGGAPAPGKFVALRLGDCAP